MWQKNGIWCQGEKEKEMKKEKNKKKNEDIENKVIYGDR